MLKKERDKAFEREILLFDKLIELEKKIEKSNVLKLKQLGYKNKKLQFGF